MKCLPSVQLVHTMCEKKAHAFIFSRTKKPSLSSEFASRALLFHVAPQCGHFLSIHDVFLLLRFRFPGLCGHMYKHWRNNCCIFSSFLSLHDSSESFMNRCKSIVFFHTTISTKSARSTHATTRHTRCAVLWTPTNPLSDLLKSKWNVRQSALTQIQQVNRWLTDCYIMRNCLHRAQRCLGLWFPWPAAFRLCTTRSQMIPVGHARVSSFRWRTDFMRCEFCWGNPVVPSEDIMSSPQFRVSNVELFLVFSTWFGWSGLRGAYAVDKTSARERYYGNHLGTLTTTMQVVAHWQKEGRLVPSDLSQRRFDSTRLQGVSFGQLRFSSVQRHDEGWNTVRTSLLVRLHAPWWMMQLWCCRLHVWTHGTENICVQIMIDHPFVFLEFSVRPRARVVAQSGNVHRVVIHGNHVLTVWLREKSSGHGSDSVRRCVFCWWNCQ